MTKFDPPSNNLAAALVTQVIHVLNLVAAGEPKAAVLACELVRPLLRGRRVLATLERLAAGALPLLRVGDSIFIAGDVEDAIAAHVEHTMDTLVHRVQSKPPLVLLQIEGDEPHAHAVQEVDGIVLVAMSRREIADRRVLAHELAHTFVMADHRVLDEGWAEWLAAACFEDGGFPAERFRERAQGAPGAKRLLSDRWRAEPCFESLSHLPAGTVHAACALVVAELDARLGTAGLMQLMSTIRDDRADNVLPLIEVACGPLEAVWGKSPVSDGRPGPEAIAEIRRAFTLGLTDGAGERLPEFSAALAAQPDNRELSAAFVMLLLLTGSDPAAAQVRLTLDGELARFVGQHGESPIGYALCLAREGMAIRLAPNFLELNDHFNRGRAIKAAALQQFPADLDVLVAAAKFEMNTPIEFGGDPAAARNLMLRAATLAPWPDVALQLRSAAQAHPGEGVAQ